jgi:hypothetical protein
MSNAMQDYEFGTGNNNSGGGNQPKIDWKAIFFNPSKGDNKLRIVSMAGKKTKVHWVTYHSSQKKVCVRCPSEGCPICIAGEKPKTNYILKVMDRATQTLRLFEFSKQIKEEIERLSAGLKKDKATANDSLSQYDINVEKGDKNANPLYHVNIIGKNKLETNKEKLLAESDAELIASDSLNIEELIKPWSIKRIREQIYGIDENGNPVQSKYNNGGAASSESAPDISFNYGDNVKAEAPKATASVAAGNGLNPKDVDFLKEL